MTKEQIIAAGIKTNSWETLEGIVKIIGFNGNKSQYTNGTTDQYYFDVDNGLLYIRYTDGHPKKYKDKLNDGYVLVSHDGKEYQIKLTPGGIKSKLGKIHAVHTIDEICAFYNKQ